MKRGFRGHVRLISLMLSFLLVLPGIDAAYAAGPTDNSSAGSRSAGQSITGSLAPRIPSPPVISLPSEQNQLAGNHVLLSGTQNNEHQAIPSIPLPGLGTEIKRYMQSELAALELQWQAYRHDAVDCSGCDAAGIANAIQASKASTTYVKAGHLNLDNSVTFGSPDKPVVVETSGINTNRKLTLTVYGTLIVNGGVNANQGAEIIVRSPNKPGVPVRSDLRVTGAFHLNNDSVVQVDGDLAAGSLTFNNGQLNVSAGRLIVENSLHINTKVDMTIREEMLVGDLVSNNETANIRISDGDLFIQGDVHVNNHLNIQTGGVWAMGGNLTSNSKPMVRTGAGGLGRTKLKYSLSGLKAEYFEERDLSGNITTVLDPNIDLKNKFPVVSAGLTDGGYSVRWSGQVEVYSLGTYTFAASVRGGVRLWIDGVKLIDNWNASGDIRQEGRVDLEGGKRYNIRMEYTGSGNQPRANLTWASSAIKEETVPSPQLLPFVQPSLTATPSDSDMTLDWTEAFNANGYELEVDGDIILLGTLTEYIHGPLESGTVHRYRVRANSGALHGEWSDLNEVWTLPGVPGPISLRSTSDSIVLEWDPVRGAVSYEIEADNSIIDNGAAVTYTESNLNPNLQRSFRVRAVNGSGPGKWSEVVAMATLPGVPGALEARATDTSVSIAWDPVSGAKWYELEIDGTVERVTASSYMHGNLLPNTEHSYRVRAGNDEGTSLWSDIVKVTTLPSVPGGLQAVVDTSSIEVSWSSVPGATGYDIEADGVVSDNGTSTTYTAQGLASNTDHSYRVRAKNGSVIGSWSALLMKTTLSDVPVNLRTVPSGTTVTLSWDPVPGASGYEVEADGVIRSTGLELTFEHTGLAANSEHHYRVRAINSGGTGRWSATVTAVTELGKAGNVRLATTASSILVSWDPIPGAASYEIAADGVVVEVAGVTSWEHTGLTPSSVHVYRVRAKSGNLTGQWSPAVTGTTMLGVPVIKDVIASSQFIWVSWEAVEGADSYDIEADGKIESTGGDTVFVHDGLAPNSGHTYRVRARSGSEAGEWSPLIGGATLLDILTFKTVKATSDSITLTWTAASGYAYDLEVDGEIVTGITTNSYIHKSLEPNTLHTYRVRARSGGSQFGPWSMSVEKKTASAMVANPGKDNIFNFVVVTPPAVYGVMDRTITVTYDPNALEVLDLSTVTPGVELSAGVIAKSGMTVVSFKPGEIVISVINPYKTFVNGIRLLAKTNNPTKVTYTVE
ncbi:fibronectin type III domain-containing protein [Paenibacillus kobensis]|uniref:fibronectin type III domain-containing protein n=1 Tax=Paenibacillus kobensis TaxID=59841 RepID=UPI000FDCB90B|nr:PA14 domain-containing protein [Paenibacillus kobensis]